MGEHAAARQPVVLPQFSSAKTRALLSLGIMLGLGAVNTTAYWTDAATLQPGSFTAGSIDLTLDDTPITTGAANSGETYTNTTIAIADLLPNESYAFSVKVANAGRSPLGYKVEGLASGPLAPGLRFAVYAGSAATHTNAGTQEAGNRAGTCGGILTSASADVDLSTEQVVVDTRRDLASEQFERLCVVIKLPLGADNSFQDTGGSLSLVFSAAQAGVDPS